MGDEDGARWLLGAGSRGILEASCETVRLSKTASLVFEHSMTSCAGCGVAYVCAHRFSCIRASGQAIRVAVVVRVKLLRFRDSDAYRL